MNLKEILDALENGHIVTAQVNGQSIPLTRHTEFTIGKRYVTVGDVLFPRGLTEPPHPGETYYIPMLDEGKLYESYKWDSTRYDQRVLKAGLVHLNEGDAVAHAKALIKLSGGSLT